jgi:hypothetical protein
LSESGFTGFLGCRIIKPETARNAIGSPPNPNRDRHAVNMRSNSGDVFMSNALKYIAIIKRPFRTRLLVPSLFGIYNPEVLS